MSKPAWFKKLKRQQRNNEVWEDTFEACSGRDGLRMTKTTPVEMRKNVDGTKRLWDYVDVKIDGENISSTERQILTRFKLRKQWTQNIAYWDLTLIIKIQDHSFSVYYSMPLNHVLNKVFNLPRDELAIANLNPMQLYGKISFSMDFKLKNFTEIPSELMSYTHVFGGSVLLTRYSIFTTSLTRHKLICPDLIFLFDVVLVEARNECPDSYHQLHVYPAGKIHPPIQLAFNSSSQFKLGSCDKRRIQLASFSHSQVDITTKQDFVDYFQMVLRQLEENSERSFTTHLDLGIDNRAQFHMANCQDAYILVAVPNYI